MSWEAAPYIPNYEILGDYSKDVKVKRSFKNNS
jgi:hypothetical protein